MFWYDGELIQGDTLKVEINEPGLLYGATVFTTLRVYHQSLDHPLTNWTAHCDRLRDSLQTFGWQLPDPKRLRQGAEALLPSFRVLRMVIFADGREWIIGRSLPGDLRERQQQGVIAWLADATLFRRSLATYKTGNYLGAWLALQQAQKLGAKEAILIDNNGNWLETSTGNLWGWKDGCWWTPPTDVGILPGIARSQLLRWLKGHGQPVKLNTWNRDFVKDLEAIAYTNSVMEVIPFCSILHQEGTLTLNPFHPALEQLRSCFRG
ncbi:MAG: aminotransferase class IV [Xenococcaceae cyanobacterium]